MSHQLPSPPLGYRWRQDVELVDGHERVEIRLLGPWGAEVERARIDLEMYGWPGVWERAARMLRHLPGGIQ